MIRNIAAPQPDLPRGLPVRIAGDYACDRMACREHHQGSATMWQWGKSLLCKKCHEDMLAIKAGAEATPEGETPPAAMCIICGVEPASKGKETCGNASQKCAKAQKRQSERDAKREQDELAEGASGL